MQGRDDSERLRERHGNWFFVDAVKPRSCTSWLLEGGNIANRITQKCSDCQQMSYTTIFGGLAVRLRCRIHDLDTASAADENSGRTDLRSWYCKRHKGHLFLGAPTIWRSRLIGCLETVSIRSFLRIRCTWSVPHRMQTVYLEQTNRNVGKDHPRKRRDRTPQSRHA